jgi:hypothetical protein
MALGSQVPADLPARAGTYSYVVSGFLAVVYALNFMDRQIMSILQEPIRSEFGLSDTQLGILTGLAFVLSATSHCSSAMRPCCRSSSSPSSCTFWSPGRCGPVTTRRSWGLTRDDRTLSLH